MGFSIVLFLFAHHFPGISGVKTQLSQTWKTLVLDILSFPKVSGSYRGTCSGHLLPPAFQLPEHDINAYQSLSGLFCSTSDDFCSAQPLADFYPYAMLESMGGNPAEPVAD